jgi:hypothetical protein
MHYDKKTLDDFLNDTDISGLSSMAEESGGLIKSETSQKEEPSEEKIIKTACRACIANCGVIATVKNGRVIKVKGNPEDPMSKGSMCAKGLSGVQALYHPSRNKYPLKRVGKRGENKWKRISWDEALETIAEKLMETKEKYGAEAVFASTGGGGNPEIWSIARFCNIFGTPNWFEPGCAQCYLPRVLAYTMMYGGVDPSIADSNALELYFPDDTPIKSLVLWGTAPSFSCPASGGGAVVDLRAKGVKTVVIDPRLTPDAAKADVWLPIRPGTDVALMFGWIRYILENKLYDEDFVMKWTNLPYLVDVKTNMLLRAEESNNPDIPDTFMVWDTKTNSAQPLEYPWNDELLPALEGSFMVDGVECKTGYQLLKERVEEFTLEITMKEDATSLLEPIKKFVEDYNAMMDLMNGLVKEKVYRDFPPLSDEQKNEMSEKEIEKWEEKAKSGVLRGDRTLQSIATKLQTTLSGLSVEGFSLYSLGITSAGYQENGKLKIDEKKLTKALETNGAEIRALFTSENGLGSEINNIINEAVKTSGPKGQRGSLIEMAGLPSTRSDTENSIHDTIERTNKIIETLKTRLTAEESRLWKSFTAMENAIQQLNVQSSILMQFSGNQNY